MPDDTTIASLLQHAFGAHVEVTATKRLSPWYVTRCTLRSDAPQVPASVIVKHGSRGEAWSQSTRVLTERAALEFLDDLGLRLAPRVIAAGHGVLVMEDLADLTPLLQVLEHREPHAAAGLLSFTRSLAQLSAETVGREQAYYDRRRALGRLDPDAERGYVYGTDIADALRHADALGAAMSPAAQSEVSRVLDTIHEPGPFAAFSGGDAGVNNFMVDTAGHGLQIDFEYARFHHALIDVSCLYVPPPAWITVGDPVASGLEAEYRRVLSRAIPQAQDDEVFGHGLVAACMIWTIHRVLRFPTMDARPPGDASRVQMVSLLEASARTADIHQAFPHLAGWCRSMAAALRRHWPDADVDLDACPAYTRRHS